jgi:parallel beta helix pectate lyase-like protein
MMKKLLLPAVGALIPLSAPAQSGELILGRIFVSPNGDDANMCAQNGPSATIDGATKPCKTITHGCALLKPNWHLELTQGFYFENVVCNATGTGPRNAVTIHNSKALGVGPTHITGEQSTTMAPVVELTGNWINFGGFHIEGGKSDGLFVHGVDAVHSSTGVNIYYDTTLSHNAGHGLHTLNTTGLIVSRDSVFNNGGDCVLIENSPGWKVYGTSIFNCGAVDFVPKTPTIGTVVTNSPHGDYEENNLKEINVSLNLSLTKSPFTSVLNNKPTVAGRPPFSFVVIPASDQSTDTFSGN